MQQEVKDNKRFKISDRSVSADNLFANPKLTPTVGAGGQYSVTPQKPQQSSWERLAEGLAGMNTALGAIAQSDVASNEAADVHGADLSTQEIIAKQAEAKEREDSFFKAGGFVDRLVRTGKASPSENPLLYSRGQRAAGNKIGLEEYPELVETRLMEAQKAYRANRTPYDVNKIQEGAIAELKEKYSIEDTFSMNRGFDSSIAKFSANQRLRDVEKKAAVDKVFDIGDAAQGVTSALAGLKGSGSDETAILSSIGDVVSQHGNLNRSDWDKVFKASFSSTADTNPQLAQTVVNMMRGGKFSGVKVGGLDMSSPTFEATLDSVESEISAIESARDHKTSESDSKRVSAIRNNLLALSAAADEDATVTPSDYGIDVQGIDDSQPIPAADLIKAYKLDEQSKAKDQGKLGLIDSAFESVDLTREGRAATTKSRQESSVNKAIYSAKNSEGLSEGRVATNLSFGEMDGAGVTKEKIAVLKDKYTRRNATIENQMRNGNYPTGVDEYKDEGGDPISIYDLSPKQLEEVATKAYRNAAELTEEEGLSMIKDVNDTAEREAVKQLEKMSSDKIENEIETDQASIAIPVGVRRRLPDSTKFLDWGLSKSENGVTSQWNAMLKIPHDDLNNTRATIQNILKTGLVHEGGRTKRGRVISATLEGKDPTRLNALLTKMDDLGYSAGDIDTYSEDTHTFTSSNMSKDFREREIALTTKWKYATDEEAQKILEFVQSKYPPFTKKMLDRLRVEPKKVKTDEK